MAVKLVTYPFVSKLCYYNEKNKHSFFGTPLACYLIIRFPHSEMWKICYRLMILALVVASFPFISSSLAARTSLDSTLITQQEDQLNSDSINMNKLLSLFFHDLTNEGLIKKTQQKSIFMSNAKNKEQGYSEIVIDYNMDHVPLNDMEKQKSLLDNTVDFIFTSNFPASFEFIDRTLKTGGVATILLKGNPSSLFHRPSNYEIAYMRRFDLVAVAMKKTRPSSFALMINTKRKLMGYALEAKKVALKNLEDVLLEPPRAASRKSRVYLKRTRYLPDLMGDTLESYPRCVFIDVGLSKKDGGSGTNWFHKNYPTRNKEFEIYKIETLNEGSSRKELPQIEMSEWLRKNVKDEEYVVMKAEAEVVEEMMRSKAIMLVDELFLECKPNLKEGNNGKRSRRAYWECLALYGKLRDEGVAVHQWWG